MRQLVTLIDRSPIGRANLDAACRLAADTAAVVLAIHPIEVPDILPLDYPMGDIVKLAWAECDRAHLMGQEFGVTLQPAVCQAHSVADAVVGFAGREAADAICLAAPRGPLGWLRWLRGPGPAIMRSSPCPVLLVGDGWRPQAVDGSGGIPTRHAERTGETSESS
ncbi:MAG: universal stress protein [Chloroflexi bacterium]|nr:universal stress protein [Chloroflexota bacterium]